MKQGFHFYIEKKALKSQIPKNTTQHLENKGGIRSWIFVR